MRIVRVDITGTTDGNGNATIKIPLPFTGAWYNVKFPLGLPGPAEWAILVSGTPVTYGRGRRVTLGPELVQDGETITVSVTGGPPSAAISGSMNGVAGEPAEILTTYSMSPNTITIDVGAPRRLLGTVSPGPNATVTQNFVLPTGTLAIAFQANSNPNAPANVTILGHTTGDTYWNATLGPLGIMRKRSIDPALDPSVDCSVTATLTLGASVDFWAVMAPEAMYVQNDNQDPLTVQSPPGGSPLSVDVTDRAARVLGVVQEGASPPLWQAPNQTPATIDVNIGAGATVVIIGAVANQALRLFGLAITAGATVQLQDTASPTPNEIGSVAAGATWAANFVGANVRQGSTTIGFQIKAPGAAASVNGMVSFSQG